MTTSPARLHRCLARAPRLLFPLRREMSVLVTLVVLATAALVGFHRQKTTASSPGGTGWFGQLAADTAISNPGMAALTSSSLVVASADLALPAVAVEPAKLRNACDSADNACVLRPITVIAPTKRVAVPDASRAPNVKRPVPPARVETVNLPAEKSRSFDVFSHFPTTATVERPFAAAGSMISGWIKRL